MAAASKAFRCNFGVLPDHQATNLQQFVRRTCAVSAIFRSDTGATVLVALRDAPRSSAAHARSVRTWLKRIGVPAIGLRGRWCFLLTDTEVLTLCAGSCSELPPREQSATAERTPREDAKDVKTIRLH